MPSMQVKNILDNIRGYHRSLAKQLESLESHESDERIQLLLEYMARHEDNFEKTLAGYKLDTATGILNTWLKYVPDDAIADSLKHLKFRDEMSADEILRVVLTFDQALIDLYSELAGETAIPRVQELFGKVLALEDRKDRQFSVSVLGLSDD